MKKKIEECKKQFHKEKKEKRKFFHCHYNNSEYSFNYRNSYDNY